MLEVMEYDNQLINTVEEKKNTIEIAKQKLDKETDEIKTLKLKVEQNKNINKNTKTLQEGYMAKLSKSEKKLNEKIVSNGADTYNISHTISQPGQNKASWTERRRGRLPCRRAGSGPARRKN